MSADDHNDKAVKISQETTAKLVQPADAKLDNLSKKNTMDTAAHQRLMTNIQSSAKRQLQETCKSSKQLQPAITHPNFNDNCQPIDPERSLLDIPMPAPRQINPMMQLYGISIEHQSLQDNDVSHHQYCSHHKERANKPYSQWELIDSPALASYLELLKAGGLIRLSDRFYRHPDPKHAKPLLKPLYPLSAQAAALDMTDIHAVMQQYPQLTRYGLQAKSSENGNKSKPANNRYNSFKNNALTKSSNQFTANLSASMRSDQLARAMPEMLNDGFAPDWEIILYPERFDNGVDSLATDLLACRLAVHVLEQCEMRQSINRKLCAQQICQYMRSYLLSQCRLSGYDADVYRHIRLYPGHVIVAGVYLGWQMQISEDDCVYFALSSRSALFTRYPNIFEYYIDGWQ